MPTDHRAHRVRRLDSMAPRDGHRSPSLDLSRAVSNAPVDRSSSRLIVCLMNVHTSVCIPTYNRPDYLEEALASVLRQSDGALEVVVGDDSTNAQTKQVVQRHIAEGAPIRYVRNTPPRGQSQNVDRLMQAAAGDYIVLLHDDDRLVDGALETLRACFANHPNVDVAFGKQQVITSDGDPHPALTRELNRTYHRTPAHSGRQPSNLRSAITQQFPNNGYMIRSAIAKDVGYVHPHAGDACDFVFGVEVAKAASGAFYYHDVCTAQYRLSEGSILRGDATNDAGYQAFKYVLRELPASVQEDRVVQQWLTLCAPEAVMRAAENGHVRDGFEWFVGPYHQPHILSLGGVRRLLYLLYAVASSRWGANRG